MKRWLYLVHRWIGIAACLVMALWFFSGVVMMYVGYPKLTPLERLAALSELPAVGCCVTPAQALAAADIRRPPEDMRLIVIGGEPTWLIREGPRNWAMVRATDGVRVPAVDEAHAARSAAAFKPGTTPRFLALIHEDTWTHSGVNPHRPMYLFTLGDEAGTEVYVSSRTGEVVRDTNRVERTWNWVGAWLHWLYMFRGNWFDFAWSGIVIWASLIATVGAALGLCIGILRWRFVSQYSGSGSYSPYRERWHRWHHILGLIFAITTITWIFSGLMSMDPWKIFTGTSRPVDTVAFAGGQLDAHAFELPPEKAIGILREVLGPLKELQCAWVDGRPWYIGINGTGESRILEAKPGARPDTLFDYRALLSAAAKLLPDERVIEQQVLTQYDNYYLKRDEHSMYGRYERRLPVLRLQFGDAESTWFHIDPYTGSMSGRIDNRARWSRWLFSGLHSWDIRGLIDRRPLWDVLMIAFALGGFVLCVTATVIGWQRVRRKVIAKSVLSKSAPAEQ